MPDFEQLPIVKSKGFKAETSYTMELEGLFETKKQDFMAKFAINPPVYCEAEGDMVPRLTYFFNVGPENQYPPNPKEVELLQHLQRMEVGHVFQASISKQGVWRVASGPGENAATEAPESPNAAPATPNPQKASRGPQGAPTASRRDYVEMMSDCFDEVSKIVGGDFDGHGTARMTNCLFVAWEKAGIHRGYAIKRQLEAAGPKPEAEGDIDFPTAVNRVAEELDGEIVP